MSSRKEQKERLRQERLERERAATASAERRRRLQIGGGVALLAIIVAVVVVVLVSSGGGGSNSSTTATTVSNTKAGGDTGVPAAAQVGLNDGPAPWKPEYSFLAQRLAAFNFPQQTDVGYHVHAQLTIYVNGKQTPVPADIGIDPQGRFISPIHTHDTSGVIHMESAKFYPFTLAEFLNVWGVYFTNNQLGSYKAGDGGNVLQLWVNGKQVADPVHYKLKAHDVLVLGYGKPGSFPHKKSFSFGQL
ncbi:MAG TPA: hypothetical protein VF032_21050 [Thermoleophilaceae bacterium]